MDSVDELVTSARTAWSWIAAILPGVTAAVLILIGGWIIAAWAGGSVRRLMERTGRFDATIVPVLAATVRYGILIIVIVAALGQLGVPTTSILAALGAAGLAIGLALQGTLSNIAAGIMLLWLRPFRAGDYIEAGDIAGSVREVGLFATELDTYDGIYRFVPNSEIWNKPIFNYTRNPARMTNMEVGISYGADIEKARRIMLDLAFEHEQVVNDPAPVVFVDNLGDSSVVLRYRVWIRTSDYWATQRHLLEETKRRFDAAGIEIPFPQRVMHMAPASAPSDAPTTEAPKLEAPKPEVAAPAPAAKRPRRKKPAATEKSLTGDEGGGG